MSYRCNLGRAFQSIAASHGERPALLLAPGQSLTYSELDQLSNRMAHWLQSLGLGRLDVLALFNAKTANGFALMLAALKLGAAYVNLDEENPPQRLSKILATCQPRLIVSDHGLSEDVLRCCQANGTPALRAPEATVLAGISPAPANDLDRTTGGDPAYLMFTSGSTGSPKGVAIAHASVLNLIDWARDEFVITPRDVLSNVNPIHFDNSVFDFYGALFNGAALAPLGRELVTSAAELVKRVDALGCTLWFSVPSLLIYLMTMRQLQQQTWPRLRCLIFGGEAYPKKELKRLFDCFHGRARLVNVYGPTECTCICSAYTLAESDFANSETLAPLGRLAANFDHLLLADDRTPAHGAIGELCLLGPQLAIAYYNDAERTARSFVANPACKHFRQTMYRTGDLVREDAQGLLWFIGRSDNQIKHLGYRIELEEIEVALNALPPVARAVALYQRIREQHGQIVAFVSTHEATSEAAIRDALKERLPVYMIPGRVEILAELPSNANGKVDRLALAQRLRSDT